MLILSVRKGEAVHFFDGGKKLGEVKYIERQSSSNQARLGFSFPHTVSIVREKLLRGEEKQA